MKYVSGDLSKRGQYKLPFMKVRMGYLKFFTSDDIKIMGPVKAPLEKINKKFRYHMIYKGKDPEMISKAVNLLLNDLKLSSNISLSVDIDPLSLM